jgi:hypothetical protein
MRTLFFTCLLVMSSGVLVSCVHANRSVEIPVQDLSSAGRDAVVRVNVPADWRPLVPSPSRAEFLAPDNRSLVYVRAVSAEADIKRCPTLARKYASEFIEAWGRPPRTRVASKISSGETVDFELRRVDPEPHGEVIWARVVCREGALAITSCTVATPREQELKPQCRDIVESLQVLARPKPPAAPADSNRSGRPPS